MSLALTLMILTALCASLTATSVVQMPRASDRSLMQFMVSSRAFTQEHPQRSLECFDYYVPLLNGITEEYEVTYAACLDSAEGDRSEVDKSTKPQREQIESSARDSCDLLHDCSGHDNSIEYFECYENTGNDNAKAMYKIAANASEILADIRERYRLIENAQKRCTDVAERAYIENTASTYEQLQSCLKGESPVPSPTPAPSTQPPTNEPATDEPATDEPATDEPATDEPATDEPATDEPATDEPATDEPATDEPTTDEPATDEPATDEPATDEPATDEPVTDKPTTDAPTTDEPATEEPATDEPATDQPITDAPVTDGPATDEPATEEPATDGPSTNEPPTGEPATDAPNSNETGNGSGSAGSGSGSESGTNSSEEELPEEDVFIIKNRERILKALKNFRRNRRNL